MNRLFLLPIFSIILCISQAQTLRYFQFTTECGHGNWQDTAFVAATSDQAVIDSVLANLERPIEERQFISGPIDYGDGGFNHNANHWFLWHFKPSQWSLADFAIEVCDGCPYTDVDADTAYWIGNLGQFCPWSGKPVREVSLVSDVNNPVFGQHGPLFYPNPSQGQITLRLPENERVQLQVLNLMGQEMAAFSYPASQQQLDLSGLKQGIYFLRFTMGDIAATQRLVMK